MTQNNRYRKTHQSAVIADAVRKRQHSNQRDPPRIVHTHHFIFAAPLRGRFFIPIFKEEILWIS